MNGEIMIKDITGRQAIILVAIVMCATKFFILPSNLLSTGGQDVIYVMILFFVVEFLLFLVLVQISMMHPDKTFYELLAGSVGTIVAKAVYILFFVFFMLKLCINIIETYSFFLGTLYDDLSPILYLLPILFLVFYMAYIGLRSIGRSAELLWIFVFFGLLMTIIVAIPNADFGYMLPIFPQGTSDALSALSNNALWFGDYLVYLFFFGKIKFEKGYFKKMAIVSGVVLALIVFFMMLFHCIFPYIASMVHYGVSDITHITVHITNIGQLDWLNVTMWTFATLIQTVIFAYCAEECLSSIFNIKSKAVSCLIVLAILVAGLIAFDFKLIQMLDFVQGPIRYIVFLLILIALSVIAVHYIYNLRHNKQNKKNKPMKTKYVGVRYEKSNN